MMKKITGSLLLLLAGLAGAAKAEATISVVSFDGLGAVDAAYYMEKELMPNLQAFSKRAAAAENMVTVAPSLTAPSHAAIATGAGPAKTGIVSNHYHTEGRKVDDNQSGFAQTLGVTPIWKEAENQGKVTAAVAFPGSNPMNAAAATYAVYPGGTLAESKLHTLEFQPVDDARTVLAGKNGGLVEESVVPLAVKGRPSENLYIIRTEEPAVYLSTDRRILGDKLEEDKWSAVRLEVQEGPAIGFYVKLKNEKEQWQLFQGTVMGSIYKGPGQFADEIEEKFGFYPAPDENEAFKAGDITREEYEEAGERFMNWIADVSSYIKRRYEPDLLFAYFSHIDNELHQFLLTSPLQLDYNMKNFAEKQAYRDWAFEKADNIIGRIVQEQTEEDTLFIVSDHGLEPIHTRLLPNKELEKAGLLKLDKDGGIDIEHSAAYAEASGTMAHVYVNLKGREKNGIVSPQQYEAVRKKIAETFADASAPAVPNRAAVFRWLAGEAGAAVHYPESAALQKRAAASPYEQVWTANMPAYEKIKTANSGDVILFAAAGYLMGKDAEIAYEPAVELGSHGSDPKRQRLRPILYAAGPSIQPQTISRQLSTTDIAPSIYQLLGLQTPEFVDGTPIFEREERE